MREHAKQKNWNCARNGVFRDNTVYNVSPMAMRVIKMVQVTTCAVREYILTEVMILKY